MNTLIEKYANKGLFIDANLLLLLLVGQIDKNFIPKFKRTTAYLVEDYELLVNFIDLFQKVIVTPNVLTEVNNLSSSLSGQHSQAFSILFAKLVKYVEEQYIESLVVVHEKAFLDYGLSDAVIVEAVKDKYLLLTDDLRFACYAQNKGVDVINFNHIRTQFWR